MRLLQSTWFAALLGSGVYLATTAALLRLPAGAQARAQHSQAVRTPNNDPSWKFRNPELDQWLAELQAEKAALAARAEQLQELQARIAADRADLSSVTQVVAQLQAEFDRNVVRFQEQEVENLRRQVKLLAALPQDTAVKMITPMSDEEITRLMTLMKTEQVSQLLDTLSKSGKEESKRAATLMELMRRTIPATAAKGAKPAS